MDIHYKLIEHERIGDAPFVGALISACNCNYDCRGCLNQYVKELPTQIDSAENIIYKIKQNLFNRGIILGGLEWSLQKDEAIELATIAHKNRLLTMLYSGSDIMTDWGKNHFDFIKLGSYIKDLTTINHIEHSVVLATSNQHIYKKGIDYH